MSALICDDCGNEALIVHWFDNETKLCDRCFMNHNSFSYLYTPGIMLEDVFDLGMGSDCDFIPF